MFDIFKSVLGMGGKALDKIFPDKEKSREAQARISEMEVSGAPSSRLRLWRSFLGWCLSIGLVWEIIARPAIATYWPEAMLPPSMIKEISGLLLSMLGLGF